MKRESNEIKKENDRAASFMRFCEVVRHLRAEDGCPWDRAQTHTSLKPYCIEEAAEVIGGINIWEATGDAENLKEELGDLMLQILLHAQIAEEEGLFTIREVMDGASEKMIRRHPQFLFPVFLWKIPFLTVFHPGKWKMPPHCQTEHPGFCNQTAQSFRLPSALNAPFSPSAWNRMPRSPSNNGVPSPRA